VVEMPVIDREKCDGCGLCISVCQCEVLVLVDNVVTIIRKEKCTHCEDVCPTGAIRWPFEIIIKER